MLIARSPDAMLPRRQHHVEDHEGTEGGGSVEARS